MNNGCMTSNLSGILYMAIIFFLNFLFFRPERDLVFQCSSLRMVLLIHHMWFDQ